MSKSVHDSISPQNDVKRNGRTVGSIKPSGLLLDIGIESTEGQAPSVQNFDVIAPYFRNNLSPLPSALWPCLTLPALGRHWRGYSRGAEEFRNFTLQSSISHGGVGTCVAALRRRRGSVVADNWAQGQASWLAWRQTPCEMLTALALEIELRVRPALCECEKLDITSRGGVVVEVSYAITRRSEESARLPV